MPGISFDWNELLAPGQVALLLMECQRGVVLPSGRFDALAEAVRQQGMLGHIARLAALARACEVPVVYLTASRRADGRGSATNCPLLAMSKDAPPLVPGSDRQRIVEELEPQTGDFVIDRMHGVSPFHGTELDPLLRNLGVRTVVATGVSLNVGILGLVIEAVNAGYRVVVPREAVAGVPASYAEDVLRFTLRWLAAITDVDTVARTWEHASTQKGSA